MKGILSKVLAKWKIKDVSELSPDDKETFAEWEVALSKEDLTLDDLKDFCKQQLGIIEGKWQNLDIAQAKKAEMIPYHTVYKTLLTAMDSPQQAREALEKHLNQLIQ